MPPAPSIIYVFGNPDLPMDSLPLTILPDLRKKFPQIQFEVKDPNEEWEVPEELTIIDTVDGIKEVKVFHDLAQFASTPRVTMHDFDALTNLRYLQKLGKIKKVKVIGVPMEISAQEALGAVIANLL